MPLHRCSEIRELVSVIGEWIFQRPFVDLKIGRVLGRMIKLDAAIELEFV